MTQTLNLNTIALLEPQQAIEHALRWLKTQAQPLHLLIQTVETSYTISEKNKGEKVYRRLKKAAKEQAGIDEPLGCLVFYMHRGRAYGLAVFFGYHHEENSFESQETARQIEGFIRQLPPKGYLNGYRFLLPLLRLCLWVYGLKNTLIHYKSPIKIPSFQPNPDLINITKNTLVYQWGTVDRLFRVVLTQSPRHPERIALSVEIPLYQKFENDQDRYACWRITDIDQQLMWYDLTKAIEKRTINQIRRIKKSYKNYIVNANTTVEKALRSRLINELYWNGVWEAFLAEAAIAYERCAFVVTDEVLLPKKEKTHFHLTTQPMGMQLNTASTWHPDGKVFRFNYAVVGEKNNDDKFKAMHRTIQERIEQFNQKNSACPVVLKAVPFNQALQGIDLLIDTIAKPAKNSWVKASSKEVLDVYGHYRRKNLQQSQLSATQSLRYALIAKDKGKSYAALYRVLLDLIAKKWLKNEPSSYQVPAALAIDQPKQFLVMGSFNWYQKKRGPAAALSNLYTVFYQLALNPAKESSSLFTVSQPQWINQLDSSKHAVQQQGLLSYLASHSQSSSHAQQLHRLLFKELALHHDVVELLDNDFLHHGAVYLFEIHKGGLQTIWHIDPTNSPYLLPDLRYDLTTSLSFMDYVTALIKSQCLSRKKNLSAMEENKRLTKEAHYHIQRQGNELLIARKLFNEQANSDKIRLLSVQRLYSKIQDTELSTIDIQPIIAGLMQDSVGQFAESGVRQLLFEKLITLMISDAPPYI